MTKKERETLIHIAENINYLASLQNANFAFSKEEDQKIKDKIRPYMSWFESCAGDLEDMVKYSQSEYPQLYKECLQKINSSAWR